MEIVGIVILGILVGAIVFYLLNRKRKGQLETLREEKADISAKLTKTQKEKADSETQLDEALTQISGLTEQVTVANKHINDLTTQLSEVSAGNENALKLLHLFELSLQLTAFALYCEMSRANHLGVENRKFGAAYKNLREAYENLHAEYKNIFDEYADFREEIEGKARRRLVQSGVGAILSLIPGVGALQLAADLIELADFASDVSDDTADFLDLLSVAELYITTSNVLEDFVDYKSIKSLQPDISSNQDHEKVEQEQRTVFKEVFEENFDQDDKEPDASDFDHFLKAIIQQMEESVESVPEDERPNAPARIVDNFEQFGIEFYAYHKSSEAPADK